jgi:hypothetical protein
MSNSYPPRIQAFRDDMIKMLPRAPNNRASLESLRAMPTRRVILAFFTCRMRLIPAKPRAVRLWSGRRNASTVSGGKAEAPTVAGEGCCREGPQVTSFRSRGQEGHHSSRRSPCGPRKGHRHGSDPAGSSPFPCGVSAPCNPKGRSGSLVFAEVLEKEFRIVAISDHRAFKRGSTEQLKFFRICHSYMAKDVPPGQPRGEAAETITNRNADAVAGALVLEGLDEGATLCARLDQ